MITTTEQFFDALKEVGAKFGKSPWDSTIIRSTNFSVGDMPCCPIACLMPQLGRGNFSALHWDGLSPELRVMVSAAADFEGSNLNQEELAIRKRLLSTDFFDESSH